jgi:hypothetical protein
MTALRRPRPTISCRADDDDDDNDDNSPNKDQNMYLKFKIQHLLYVKILYLFGDVRDRLNTEGIFNQILKFSVLNFINFLRTDNFNFN